MSEQLYFEPDFSSSSKRTTSTPVKPFAKPNDDFSTPPLAPDTVFYEIFGPETTFAALLPKVIDIVSNSPKAIDKLDAIRDITDVWGDSEPNLEFAEMGFKTFVVEGQRGIYTVLEILREENKTVKEELPSPVYVITSHGPLVDGKGYVETTKLIGSYVDQKEAQDMAEKVMEDLVRGEKGLKKSVEWRKESKGGGMLMAMGVSKRWEVKVAYEDQVHMRAKDDLDRGREDIGWRF
jgi:hypothetical protein